MTPISKSTKIKDWIKLGELCKEIQHKSVEAQVLAHNLLPMVDCRYIDNTADNISKFKCHAEDVMFVKINWRKIEDSENINGIRIFYGDMTNNAKQ